jgi:hypothetical protein
MLLLRQASNFFSTEIYRDKVSVRCLIRLRSILVVPHPRFRVYVFWFRVVVRPVCAFHDNDYYCRLDGLMVVVGNIEKEGESS